MGTQPENTHSIQTQTQPIPEFWFRFGYYPWVPAIWVPNPRHNVSEQSQMSDIFGSHAMLELDEQRSVD